MKTELIPLLDEPTISLPRIDFRLPGQREPWAPRHSVGGNAGRGPRDLNEIFGQQQSLQALQQQAQQFAAFGSPFHGAAVALDRLFRP